MVSICHDDLLTFVFCRSNNFVYIIICIYIDCTILHFLYIDLHYLAATVVHARRGTRRLALSRERSGRDRNIMSLGVTECFVFAKVSLITVSIILFVFDFFCHTIVYYYMSIIVSPCIINVHKL